MLGASYGTGYAITRELNPVEWFKDKDENGQANNEKIIAYTSDGKPMRSGGSYVMPRGVTFMSQQKSTEYAPTGEFNVTATLSNDYVNGAFDWTVTYTDTAVETTAPEYYLQVESISATEAKVKYIAPFDNQIVLTATLRGTNKTDNCTIDCIKSVELANTAPTPCFSDFEDGYELEQAVIFNKGTLAGDFFNGEIMVTLESDFIEAVKKYLKFDLDIIATHVEKDMTGMLERPENPYIIVSSNKLIDYSMFIENFNDYDTAHKEAIYYAWYQACTNYGRSNNAQISFKISYGYGGNIITLLDSNEELCEISGGNHGSSITPEGNVNINTNVIF